MKCNRCKKETNVSIMSMLNTQEICMECKDKEKQHPRYEEAQQREFEEVLKGNLNYRGLLA